MTWPRYKLNYAFNHGAKVYTQDEQEEFLKFIEDFDHNATRENALHEVLQIFFLTSQDESLAMLAKSKLNAIADKIYGHDVQDGRKEAFFEAVETNIVYVKSLDDWDVEQWCMKSDLDPEEVELF